MVNNNHWRNFSQTAVRILSERAEVHITHLRKFNFKMNGSVVETNYMSRSRYEKSNFVAKMSETIDQFGGATEVKIKFDDGREITGMHSFNDKRFCRSLGTMVAIRKALSSVGENELLEEIQNKSKAA